MDNVGIYCDFHNVLPVDTFVQRHELSKLYLAVSEMSCSSLDIPTFHISAEKLNESTFASLLEGIHKKNPDCNIYLSVLPKQIPQLIGRNELGKLYFCNAEGCCSAENLHRMILLGCGSEYLPADLLNDCPKEFGAECKNLPLGELKQTVMVLYDKKRIAHAIGCCEMAEELARHYGADPDAAARAGILHDITKILTVPEQLRLCKKYGIMTDDYSGPMSKLLHAKTAAAVAAQVFGETEEVCEAISWHTTGKANMTLLSKIIYIADYIEVNRKFEGVERLRKLAFDNLDAAVLCGVQMTIDTLTANHRPLNRFTLEARDSLLLEEKVQ